MQAGLDRLIVRLIDVMRDGEEVSIKPGKAVSLADGVGVVLRLSPNVTLRVGTMPTRLGRIDPVNTAQLVG